MELRGKALPILILIAIISALIIAGCGRDEQVPKRPVTPREKTTTEDATLTRRAQQPSTQATATEARKMADKLTNKAVEVKGVRSATVVVQPANNRYTVLVGLTLDSEVKEAQTSAIKKEVSEKLSQTDKRIDRVLVTSNPDLVKRIEDIARGILGGKPVQSFADEITEVTKRIAPTID